MDDLVKLVAEKTGLPPATARTAVETVVGYIKQRLPEPLAAQVDTVIAGADLSGILNQMRQMVRVYRFGHIIKSTLFECLYGGMP